MIRSRSLMPLLGVKWWAYNSKTDNLYQVVDNEETAGFGAKDKCKFAEAR